MDPRAYFSPDEQAAIQAAADAAETRTSGEIVPYVVGRCDAYPEAGWAGAALGALGGTALAVLVQAVGSYWGGSWGSPGLLWLSLPPLVGAAVGAFLATSVPTVARRLITSTTLDQRVRLRAEAAFLEEEVFDTRDRTGVLIMLALFEHRAVVLGDSGINAAVAPEAWQGVIDGLVSGIRAGRPADALIEAIEACSHLLEARDVTPRRDDTDELADHLRVRDE